MQELIKKIRKFEEKSGLKLYNEIMDDLGKFKRDLDELRISRDNWKNKYMELKK